MNFYPWQQLHVSHKEIVFCLFTFKPSNQIHQRGKEAERERLIFHLGELGLQNQVGGICGLFVQWTKMEELLVIRLVVIQDFCPTFFFFLTVAWSIWKKTIGHLTHLQS